MAAVVLEPGASVSEDELRAHVRGSCARPGRPSASRSRDELPFNETGKLLRRTLRDELAGEFEVGQPA